MVLPDMIEIGTIPHTVVDFDNTTHPQTMISYVVHERKKRREMYKITRKYSFSAAHRIEGHPKCGRLHGHNYEVTVELSGNHLPPDGMLMDYARLDDFVKPIIQLMDHRYIVSQSNHAANDPYEQVALMRGDIYPLNCPASTAEYLALFLHEEIMAGFWDETMAITRNQLRVTVQETEKSTATYETEDE